MKKAKNLTHIIFDGTLVEGEIKACISYYLIEVVDEDQLDIDDKTIGHISYGASEEWVEGGYPWRHRIVHDSEGEINFPNGISYAFNRIYREEGIIYCELSRIKNHSTLKCSGKSLCVGAHIMCSDGKFVLAELDQATVANDKYSLVEGRFRSELDVKNIVFNSMYQELEEGISVVKSDIDSIELKTIILNMKKLGFCFNVKLNISSKELLEKISHTKEIDAACIHLFGKEKYLELLDVNKEIDGAYIKNVKFF